jgi:hypothetical protein
MKELAYQIDDDDDEIRKDKMGKACSIQEGWESIQFQLEKLKGTDH